MPTINNLLAVGLLILVAWAVGHFVFGAW